jgi:hypothetical protein
LFSGEASVFFFASFRDISRGIPARIYLHLKRRKQEALFIPAQTVLSEKKSLSNKFGKGLINMKTCF